MKKPFRRETAFNIVLSVSPNDDDCVSLERIFESGWTVISSSTVALALSVLRRATNSNRHLRLDISSGTGGDVGPRSRFSPIPLFLS